MQNFRNKISREIRLWAWAAAVLPITSLACLFFIWAFGTNRILDIAMATGGTIMFSVAVFWWWWALHTIKKLIENWNITRENVIIVLEEVKEVKNIVKDVIVVQQDK